MLSVLWLLEPAVVHCCCCCCCTGPSTATALAVAEVDGCVVAVSQAGRLSLSTRAALTPSIKSSWATWRTAMRYSICVTDMERRVMQEVHTECETKEESESESVESVSVRDEQYMNTNAPPVEGSGCLSDPHPAFTGGLPQRGRFKTVHLSVHPPPHLSPLPPPSPTTDVPIKPRVLPQQHRTCMVPCNVARSGSAASPSTTTSRPHVGCGSGKQPPPAALLPPLLPSLLLSMQLLC